VIRVISVTSHDTGNDARTIARSMAVVPMKKDTNGTPDWEPSEGSTAKA